MSGPIVRKYGFPNFERIFGERELQHGVDEGEAGAEATVAPAKEKKATARKPAAKSKAPKKPK